MFWKLNQKNSEVDLDDVKLMICFRKSKDFEKFKLRKKIQVNYVLIWLTEIKVKHF